MTQSFSNVFDDLATITITTKRQPADLSSAHVAYITTPIASTGLAPVNPEIVARLNLGSPFELKQIYVFQLADIKEGDLVTIGSTDYRVVGVAEWPWLTTTYLHIILEEDK